MCDEIPTLQVEFVQFEVEHRFSNTLKVMWCNTRVVKK